MQNYLFPPNHQGVTSISSALIAGNHIACCAQYVNYLALALIAPLGAYDDRIGHILSLPARILDIPSKRGTDSSNIACKRKILAGSEMGIWQVWLSLASPRAAPNRKRPNRAIEWRPRRNRFVYPVAEPAADAGTALTFSRPIGRRTA